MMRKAPLLLFVLVAFAFSYAQSGAPASDSQQQAQLGSRPQGSAASAGEVPTGTEIRATLDTPLSTKTSKPGDTFTATVQQPVRGASGAVVIPAGAHIRGEVAEAEQGKLLPSVRGRGKLSLRFQSITLPGGASVPLHADLASVTSTQGTSGTSGASTNQEGQVQGGASAGTAAKSVGIGAGAGTLAGLIFGHAVRGLVLGALAGGGYVLATKGKDVNLPAQTGLVLRVSEPLAVPASAGGGAGSGGSPR